MKTITLTILFFVITLHLFGQKIESFTISGTEEIGKREILIYTPVEYTDTLKCFEVVYVFDSQVREMFDAVHSTIAFQNKGLRPMIVVGIVSENRNKDFLPKNKHPETVQEQAGQLGNASFFSDFIEKTLMPYVDENYRTLPTKIGIGHSNGATFINYTMLTKPNLFNVIFSIDANFNYDKGQLIEQIKNNSELNQSNIFYYTCQTASGESWVKNSELFNSILSENSTITFKSDFFQNENHTTVFQQGVINAFKEYFNYQFFNSEKIIEYFKEFEKNGQYVLSKKEIHHIASFFLNNGSTADAKQVFQSFQDKLNGDIENSNDLYELFDTGDLYFNLGFTEIAKKYFLLCDSKLETNKKNISDDFYNFGKDKIKEKLKMIDENK